MKLDLADKFWIGISIEMIILLGLLVETVINWKS